jgi:DNA-binding transcriptional ArsR family regulator
VNTGLTSLLKILKDETRRQIILLLNNKGSLTYTELMDSLEVVSTGLLNYHLKVLDDLLAKDEEGKYVLSEKGKLASRLLLEFPDDNNNIRKKPTWWRKFWIAEAIVIPIYSAINIALYFRGYIDAAALYTLTLSGFACIGIGYMIAHIKKDVLSAQGLLKLNRALYLLVGLFTGGFLIWVGLIVAMNMIGVSFWLKGIIGDGTFAITTVIPCYIAGYLLGDWIGKKTNYYIPHYP